MGVYKLLNNFETMLSSIQVGAVTLLRRGGESGTSFDLDAVKRAGHGAIVRIIQRHANLSKAVCTSQSGVYKWLTDASNTQRPEDHIEVRAMDPEDDVAGPEGVPVDGAWLKYFNGRLQDNSTQTYGAPPTPMSPPPSLLTLLRPSLASRFLVQAIVGATQLTIWVCRSLNLQMPAFFSSHFLPSTLRPNTSLCPLAYSGGTQRTMAYRGKNANHDALLKECRKRGCTIGGVGLAALMFAGTSVESRLAKEGGQAGG
eukprot:CAMPEP_0169484410 /NCGR_PEP_ID=MMETSP1042-20121227/31743_1 /TAXON_ID=464988 /ORGANISM="Hemiselmis andersenii, Strain CCMP1180" /LENGTH=256 /DNA_ID=CAMNT_0009599441 /DNA_START=15 /DNA_END=782 /DNA_ORIENTATION=+